MPRHAFLIMAHNEPNILNKLFLLLDDKRNDIFVHWDKKSKCPFLVKLKYSKVYLLSKINVGWSEYSIVECEMILFDQAYNKGPYDYYHLLSGVDLPLHSNNYIYNFFDQNKGKKFVGIMDEKSCLRCYKRVHYYYFVRYGRGRLGRFIILFNALSVKLQKVFRIDRNKDIVFKKGATWISITQDFMEYVLKNRKLVRQVFRNTFCPDEMFVQTLLWNSRFKDSLYVPEEAGEHNMCIREID